MITYHDVNRQRCPELMMWNDALSCSATCNVNESAQDKVHDPRHKESETQHDAQDQDLKKLEVKLCQVMIYTFTNTKYNLKHKTNIWTVIHSSPTHSSEM